MTMSVGWRPSSIAMAGADMIGGAAPSTASPSTRPGSSAVPPDQGERGGEASAGAQHAARRTQARWEPGRLQQRLQGRGIDAREGDRHEDEDRNGQQRPRRRRELRQGEPEKMLSAKPCVP